ncbi:MAG: T9SS type A sorting domain-containing protein [Candidatus Cloacimonetes bacterium]|nr:T9SS type A sorting domain-containing protein [Candidatus Cloacimonadota bacterium]
MRWVYFELILFGDPSTSVKDPCGNFPYVQPVTSTFDDLQGDGDGIANPGETIDIYVTLENLAGWSDAEDVYALISFPDNNIVIVQDSVYYGYIASGNSSTGESFIIDIPQDVIYGSYEYQLDVYAFTTRDVIFHKVYNMDIEISLYQKYWPWFTQNNIPSNPICLDFNEDGYREIMVLNSFADVHLLDIYAEELPGYPWNNEENIWKSTALADLNNDNLMDLVIASRNGKVIALSNSGEELFIYDDCMEQLLTPVIADITGDYVPEVISFGIDRNLLALDIYGQPLPGFPVMLSMITGSEFAVADLDDNGTADIMIGTNDGIFNAIDCNGDQLPGYPVQLTGPVCAAPTVLTDKKIITGTCANILYVLSPAGELLVEKELNARIAGSVIAADFDNDEILEIAFVTVLGELYIIEQDGMELPGWPVDLEGQFAHPPLAADLDNDENVDLVVLSSFNCVHAYHADGTEFGFSPVPTNLSGSTPASIEDFDHDGDYDIICGSTDGVFVIDCKLPKGEKLPWRTYRGNYNRSGYYEDNLLVGNGSEIIPILITRLDQNYPNPFNPSTTIAFQLANASGVELAVFNIKGQKVCTLSNNIYFEKGYHEIIWQGTDQNDREVPSGIYFYRFRGDGKASVRKMLLLK